MSRVCITALTSRCMREPPSLQQSLVVCLAIRPPVWLLGERLPYHQIAQTRHARIRRERKEDVNVRDWLLNSRHVRYPEDDRLRTTRYEGGRFVSKSHLTLRCDSPACSPHKRWDIARHLAYARLGWRYELFDDPVQRPFP